MDIMIYDKINMSCEFFRRKSIIILTTLICEKNYDINIHQKILVVIYASIGFLPNVESHNSFKMATLI